MIPLYSLYVLNLFFLAAGFYFSFKMRRIYSILWASLTAFHVFFAFILHNLLNDFSLSTIQNGQALMALGNFLLLCVVVVLDLLFLQKKRVGTIVLSTLTMRRVVKRYFLMMLTIVVLILAIRFRGGTSAAYSNWETYRLSAGLLGSFSTLLAYIFFPSIWVALKQKKWLLTILLGGIGVVIFFVIGSRAMLLTLPCAVYLDLLFWSAPWQRKSVFLIILAGSTFLLHTFVRLVRGLGLAGFLALVFSGGLLTTLNNYRAIDFSGGESEINKYYYYVIEKDYDHYPYKHGVTLTRMAMMFIPHSKFPEIKPQDITYQLWIDALNDGLFHKHLEALEKALEAGRPGSIHPTFWGDAYLNLGFWGILLYPLIFGFGFVFIEYWIFSLTPIGIFLIGPLIGTCYMMVARGNITIGLGYIVYIVPIVMIIVFLFKIPIFFGFKFCRETHVPHSVSI